MFDISPLELLTIALIALIVFGPQRLPELARKAGSYIREIRKAATELTAGLDREVQELQQPLKDIKQDLTKPMSELKATLDETAKGIQNPLREVGEELRKPVNPGGPTPAPDGSPAEPPPLSEDEPPRARWIADEPAVGVSPGDAWKGVDDPLPPGAGEPEPSDDASGPGEPEPSDDASRPGTGQPDDEAEAESA